MSWVRIWVHLVFSTKNRTPFLKTRELRTAIFDHMKEEASKKDIWLDTIGGYHDHVHCLISLRKSQTISQVAQLLKGESSHWMNKAKLLDDHFTWQDDYWAVSVSESHTPSVRNYINNQEEHHKRKTFTDEIDEFMKKYGWVLVKGE